jgi:hypothetical protein
MPVIPSFSAFAQTPNLAQAWLGGQELQVEKQKIAQDAAEAAARISLGYAQLRNQAEQATMEWNTRKEISNQEGLRRQQEMEYQKSYQQQQIGLAEQGLKQDAQKLQLDVEQATRQATARHVYQTQRQKYIQQNFSEKEATIKAATEAGPDVGLPASVWSEGMKQPEKNLDVPEEVYGPSGELYTRYTEGGPFSRTATGSDDANFETKSRVDSVKKELDTLRMKQAKSDPNTAKYYSMATKMTASQPSAADLKAYNAMGKDQKAQVDKIIDERKRMVELQAELDQLFRPGQAYAPPGVGTNAPPRILRKTKK